MSFLFKNLFQITLFYGSFEKKNREKNLQNSYKTMLEQKASKQANYIYKKNCKLIWKTLYVFMSYMSRTRYLHICKTFSYYTYFYGNFLLWYFSFFHIFLYGSHQQPWKKAHSSNQALFSHSGRSFYNINSFNFCSFQNQFILSIGSTQKVGRLLYTKGHIYGAFLYKKILLFLYTINSW